MPMTLEVLQPKPFDLVGNPIQIAGNATGFEGHLSITVDDGHYLVSKPAHAGSMAITQFQTDIEIPEDHEFKLSQLFVTVTDDSASEEGVPIPTVIVPVLYGPMIVDDYIGYWNYEVVRGDTLWALAEKFYEDGTKYPVIQQANQHLIANPDLIFPGQILRIARSF